jgi:uncharacterized protein (DUF4213/DUF364 family)
MIVREVYAYLNAELDSVPRVEQIVVNTGFTGVLLDNGEAGIAMNIRSGIRPAGVELEFLKGEIGRSALTLAEQAWSDHLLLASAGVAALSALSQPFLNQVFLDQHRLVASSESFSDVLASDVVPGTRVGMVGFGGAVRGVARKAAEVIVTELDPDLFQSYLLGREGMVEGPTGVRLVDVEEGRELLRTVDTLLVTGCALVSQSLDELLETSNAPRIIVYGPTASVLPLPLFRRSQVFKVTTIHITDGAGMINLLASGGGAVERFFPEFSQNLTITRAVGD